MQSHRQPSRTLRIVVIAATVALTASCASTRTCPVCEGETERAKLATYTDESSIYDSPPTQPLDIQKALGRSFNKDGVSDATLLALSGGGAKGAWGVGVLKGWSPEKKFTIVTGISTGALIAPFAYLQIWDTPYYPGFATRDIHRKRWLISLLFKNALYKTEPLREQIRDHIERNDVIAGVAKEYIDTERLLYIGTVNMDSGEFCAWPMHWIAKQHGTAGEEGRSEDKEWLERLFLDVLYASTVVPGIYPPIEIDPPPKGHEYLDPGVCAYGMHADGGIRRGAFVKFAEAMRIAWDIEWNKNKDKMTPALTEEPEKQPAYIIVNKKLIPNRKCVADGFKPIVLRGIGLLNKAAQIGNLYQIKAELERQDSSPPWEFNLSFIPNEYQLDFSNEQFVPEKLKRLYDAGRGFGESPSWVQDIPQVAVSELACNQDAD